MNSSSTIDNKEIRSPKTSEAKPLNLGQLLRNYLGYWHWFVIALAIGLTGSYLYLRYTPPIYTSSVKVLIQDDKASGQLSESSFFEDLGVGSKREQNTENEIEVLKSSFLMKEVVQNLGLQYRNIQKGSVRDVDLYTDGPIQVLSWEPVDQTSGSGISFIVNAASNSMNYVAQYGDKKYAGRFGSRLSLPTGKITLSRKAVGSIGAIHDIIVDVCDPSTCASTYINSLSIGVLGKKSTVLKLDLSDVHPVRARDILNELVKVYDASQVADKNRVLKNTITFIDERIKILSTDLAYVETDVEQYKKDNKITNLSAQGELLMQEVSQYSKSYTDINLQLDILKGIKDILSKDPARFEFVPSNSGLTNLTLTGLMQSFNQLLIERDKAKSTLGSNHPTIAMMESQLGNLRTNILNNIVNIERDLKATSQSVKIREQSLSNRLTVLPKQERELIEIQRQQGIKQNLYLYLLQKREETALDLAVAVGNSRIVEPAAVGGRTKPKPETIWLLGSIFGLILPLLLINLLKALNNKVWAEADISEHTSVSTIGVLTFVNQVDKVVVKEKSRSAISEMFRLMRANLQFVGEGMHNKVILVTSSTSGEGKSFVSVNLGMTLALTGKKVMMIELDLRKPKLATYLGHKRGEGKGITEYLVKGELDWKQVINVSDHHPMMHYISTGPIPPNPAELLLSVRLKELIEILKTEYDYIIMDTPPVGLVSDALLLGSMCDVSLYIVRQGKTAFTQLNILEDIAINQKLPRPFIVFNAVNMRRTGYGYGYGYGYYQDEKKSSRSIKNLFSRS